MKNIRLNKLVLSAVFLALGIILPFFTGQIKEIGDSLLPMHLPVLLCGFICGWQYGITVGAIVPFLRSLMFGMPPLYPTAVWMSIELLTYGCISGLLYSLLKKRGVIGIYISLIGAMLCGRVVWGIAKAILLGISDKPFGISAFIMGAFVDAVPGIIIQLVLIPMIVCAIDHKKNK